MNAIDASPYREYVDRLMERAHEEFVKGNRLPIVQLFDLVPSIFAYVHDLLVAGAKTKAKAEGRLPGPPFPEIERRGDAPRWLTLDVPSLPSGERVRLIPVLDDSERAEREPAKKEFYDYLHRQSQLSSRT